MVYSQNKIELEEKGFSITPLVYNESEIKKIISFIDNVKCNSNSIIETKELFAIRQLIILIPELWDLLFNKSLCELINTIGGPEYFLTKAIYFDKPKNSNWFVSYHQDLSINVNEKCDIKDYKNWTKKRNQIGVQPPLTILENIFTIRIHLDVTDKDNGALRMIPKSHLNGIIRTDSGKISVKDEIVCDIKKGATMLMKPLTLHASSKTKNKKQRRVIHLEFSNIELKKPIRWKEKRVRATKV